MLAELPCFAPLIAAVRGDAGLLVQRFAVELCTTAVEQACERGRRPWARVVRRERTALPPANRRMPPAARLLPARRVSSTRPPRASYPQETTSPGVRGTFLPFVGAEMTTQFIAALATSLEPLAEPPADGAAAGNDDEEDDDSDETFAMTALVGLASALLAKVTAVFSRVTAV